MKKFRNFLRHPENPQGNQGDGAVWKKNDPGYERNLSHVKPSARDQLEYLSDLLLELKEMARAHHLETLVAILDLARAEAQLRAKELL